MPEELLRKHRLKEGATYGDAIALGQALAALQGRTDAAREIANRVEGRVVEHVEIAGAVTYISLIPHADRKKKVTS